MDMRVCRFTEPNGGCAGESGRVESLALLTRCLIKSKITTL